MARSPMTSRGRLSANPSSAFSFDGSDLLRTCTCATTLFDGVSTDTMVDILEAACSYADHFALWAAFQVCAGRVGQDMRFTKLGDRLLDRLFGDMSA